MKEKKDMVCGVYTIREIATDIYQIEEFGVFCYLVVGSKQALLIDTGTGFGDLAAAVRTITDKPLLVAATHAHPDHIGGRGCFPVLYLPKKDRGIARFYGTLWMRRMMFGKAAQRKYGKTRKDILRGKYRTKYRFMSNGGVFDLGGRTVRAVETSGHTKGHCAFCVEEDNILFTGDDVCPALWMFLPGSTTVETWISGAQRILAYSDTHTLYTAHAPDPLDPTLLRKLIGTGTELVQTTKNGLMPKVRVYPTQYTDHGILYRATRVRNKRRHDKRRSLT